MVPPDELLIAKTISIHNSTNTTSDVTIYTTSNNSSSKVCMYGVAEQLPADIVSASVMGGTDCTLPNGCGAHIHQGRSCEAELQLGHYYNTDTFSVDPWLRSGYESTDSMGVGHFIDCLETGVEDGFEGRAFIVHDNDGGRVSCGLLEFGNLPATPTTPPSTDDSRAPPIVVRSLVVGWVAAIVAVLM